MKCQRCGSQRILRARSHGQDCQNYSIGNKSISGYATEIPDICREDSLHPNICLDCGQCQGKFPKPPTSLERNEPE